MRFFTCFCWWKSTGLLFSKFQRCLFRLFGEILTEPFTLAARWGGSGRRSSSPPSTVVSSPDCSPCLKDFSWWILPPKIVWWIFVWTFWLKSVALDNYSIKTIEILVLKSKTKTKCTHFYHRIFCVNFIFCGWEFVLVHVLNTKTYPVFHSGISWGTVGQTCDNFSRLDLNQPWWHLPPVSFMEFWPVSKNKKMVGSSDQNPSCSRYI